MNELEDRVTAVFLPKCRGFGPGNIPEMVAREFAVAALQAIREPPESLCDDAKSVWRLMMEEVAA